MNYSDRYDLRLCFEKVKQAYSIQKKAGTDGCIKHTFVTKYQLVKQLENKICEIDINQNNVETSICE